MASSCFSNYCSANSEEMTGKTIVVFRELSPVRTIAAFANSAPCKTVPAKTYNFAILLQIGAKKPGICTLTLPVASALMRKRETSVCKFQGFLHQSALYGSKITDEKSRKANVTSYIRNELRPDTGCISKKPG
jgi:hypothetical protein